MGAESKHGIFHQTRIFDSHVAIEFTLSINEFLITKAFAYTNQISLDQSTITDIRQIEVLFEKLEHVEEPSLLGFKSIKEQISNATNQLRAVAHNIEEENNIEHIPMTNQSMTLLINPNYYLAFNSLLTNWRTLLFPK